MKHISFFILLFFILSSCENKLTKYPYIELRTSFGNIEVELYPVQAPVTVKAFLSYIDSGLFNNSSFYRVLKSEDQPSSAFKSDIIQGGIWGSDNNKARSLKGITHETTQQTGILHKNGIISLARTSAGTASSEFFICIGDQPSFDYGGNANPDKQGFAAFGKVIKGMDVVELIHKQPDYNGNFQPPILIKEIVRL